MLLLLPAVPSLCFIKKDYNGSRVATGQERRESPAPACLSYAAAVWAPALALAAAARPVVGSSGHSAAELQHSRALQRLLGPPTRTPVATK